MGRRPTPLLFSRRLLLSLNLRFLQPLPILLALSQAIRKSRFSFPCTVRLHEALSYQSGRRPRVFILTYVTRFGHNVPYISSLFHDALLGLDFLHSHNWVHRDLKPGNIGSLDEGPPHVVLLDFEGAVNLQQGELLPATPGRCGTVNYLAPERELQAHDCLIDVWSMGVIGFELLHGYHPWKLALNPWRPGNQFEALRPTFHNAYREAVQEMKHHVNTECKTHLSRNEGTS